MITGPNLSRSWIIADIGATNSRCALIAPPSFELANIRHYRNDDAESLQKLLEFYLTETNTHQTDCAIAVAAPIHGDDVQMCNRDWKFSRDEISRKLGVDQTIVINDFHVIGHALPHIDDYHRVEIGSATRYRRGNIAVLGPGSRLGMAAWIDNDSSCAVMSGEGGHVTVLRV